MKKNTFAMIGIALICMMYLCGCGKQSTDDPNKQVSVPITATATPGNDQLGLTLEPFSEYQELSIYSIDALSKEKYAVTAVISGDQELTPRLIVDKVVESMADETFTVGIDDVSTEDETIIVSFLDNQPPVVNVDSDIEGEILDAIAQSLLDNLQEYHKVCFRVMGEAYQSSNFKFDLNQTYLETN